MNSLERLRTEERKARKKPIVSDHMTGITVINAVRRADPGQTREFVLRNKGGKPVCFSATLHQGSGGEEVLETDMPEELREELFPELHWDGNMLHMLNRDKMIGRRGGIDQIVQDLRHVSDRLHERYGSPRE